MPIPRFERTASWESSYSAARPFMMRASDEGMSFNTFYDISKESGISYRRERMLEDWRSIQGLYVKEALINALTPTKAIPDAFTQLGPEGQTMAYRGIIQYKYDDPTTGETLTGVRVIGSDKPLSRARFEEIASRAFEENRPYADPSAREFSLRAVYRKG